MWDRRLFGLLMTGILFLSLLNAQPTKYFSQVQYFTTDEGLSQNEITCILQDQMGFMWIGTRGGLNRYDGYGFKVFQNEVGNPNSLVNNSIESLLEDSRGCIWIGTKSNGLSCYNPKQDQFTHYPANTDGIRGNRIIALAEGPTGRIWVGTWQNGLSILDPADGSVQHHLKGIKVEDIIQGKNENMWIATQTGLYAYSGEAFTRYTPNQHVQNFVSLIEDTSLNRLFLGTWNQGIIAFDICKETFEPVPSLGLDGFQLRNAYHLFLNPEGDIWLGTWGQGLFQLDPKSGILTSYSLTPQEQERGKELYRDVLFTYQDRSGILWLGTNGGGLLKVEKEVFQFGADQSLGSESALPREPVWAVHADPKGRIWAGTRGTAAVFLSLDHGQKFQRLEFGPSAMQRGRGSMKEGVKAFLTDQQGTLWMGTNQFLARVEDAGEGIQVIPKLIREAHDSTPASAIRTSCLYQGRDGIFWIGSQQQGLRRSLRAGSPDTQPFVSYHKENTPGSLQSNRISSIFQDQKSRYWIGTYGGLHLYRPKSDDFRVFQKRNQDPNSLSSDIILCLHEDKRGQLWIGTPNGLNRADWQTDSSLTFHCYQQKDGLPNNYVHAILEDQQGNLWISTNRGISRFDPQVQTFENYDVNDGLQANSFMEGVASMDQEGRFYYGGIYGLNFFHPDSIQRRSISPSIAITGLKIFNKAVQVGDTTEHEGILSQAIEYTSSITLDYSQNVFTLEYTALDFHSPDQLSYEYKLEELEKNWNQVDQQRSVTYTQLQPGNYTFRVRAAPHEAQKAIQEARLHIRVLSPFWATWQAFLLYTLIFIGILILYRRVIGQQNELKNKLALERVAREKEGELADMKTRFFTNITHELRTPLTLIAGPVEQMMQQPELPNKLKDYLLTMHHHTRRLLDLVSQLLDFRKAETGHMELQVAEGDFVRFAREVALSFQELAERTRTELIFEVETEPLSLYFDRNKMEIVLCNLLSNAFKYSPEGSRILFRVQQIGDTHCKITVEDNGQGMSPQVVEQIFDRFYQVVNAESVSVRGTGIGLSLVKTIADLHHGSVTVQSELGQGSTFTLHIPLGKTHFDPTQLIENFRDSEHVSHYQLGKETSTTEISEENPLDTPPDGPRPKLLLVEDNLEIRAFLCTLFAEDYLLHEAENGRVGLEKAREIQPDLIISDVMMPEMDGQTFCRTLRQDAEIGHLPVILLTARTSTVFQVEGYQSGADAYVTKPFQPSVLRAQVENLLTVRQQWRQYFSQKVTLQPTEVEVSSLDAEFLNQLMKIVEENLLNETLSRDFLADAMAMSESTLYRKLKTLTGLTTNAFIRSIRLKRAGQLLRDSEYNVSEVAFRVGFNDLKYFRTCFKEQFGANPSEYSASQEVADMGKVKK